MCDCKVGPGKFEGEDALTALAYFWAGNGFADETHGSHDCFKAPFNFDTDDDALAFARQAGFCEDCIAEALGSQAKGLIFWEDSQGFAYCREYDTNEDYSAASAELENEDEDEDETA